MSTKVKDVLVRCRHTRSTNHTPPVTVSQLLTHQNVRIGSSNPSWKAQIAAGANAATALSGTEASIKLLPASASSIVKNGWYDAPSGKFVDHMETIQGQYLVPSFPIIITAISATKANNQALTRLYQAIRQSRTAFSGGTFLGELKESLELIRSATKKIAAKIPAHLASQQRMAVRYVGSYVIGPNGSAVRVPRKYYDLRPAVRRDLADNLADAWLSFSFGLRPLVKDIQSAAEALARFNEQIVKTKVHGYGEEQYGPYSVQTYNLAPFGGGHLNCNVHSFRTSKVQVIYSAGLYLTARRDGPLDSMTTFAETFGFTAEEFVPTVWNLLPYSFLVDYFVNVGDLLMAMTTDTSSVRWIVKDVIQSSTEECSSTIGGSTDVLSQGGSFGGYSTTTRTVSRSVEAILQLPQLEVKLPDTANQFANILALLTGGNRYARGY